MSKFKDIPQSFNQFELFPANVFDLLPDDHDCFLYRDLFQQLDTAEIEKGYSPIGQKAYHPRKIISILIYGYSHGVFSSRQLAQRCKQDLSFMYIAERDCPNFRVLSDFRKKYHAEFKGLFKQTVQLAQGLGLVQLGHVSLDGSKFKANTSKHKAMTYKHLKRLEAELDAKVSDLVARAEKEDEQDNQLYFDETGYSIPEDLKFNKDRLSKIRKAKQALEQREALESPGKKIPDKKQISFADVDAKIMGKKGSFNYSYNAQICVDEEHQIIVEQHVNANANDTDEVEQSLAGLKECTEQLPEKMSLDHGYWSGDNLVLLEEEGVDGYVASGRGEITSNEGVVNTFDKIEFLYIESEDHFICPAEKTLSLTQSDKNGRKIYSSSYEVCSTCQHYSACVKAKKKVGRSVTVTRHEDKLRAMKKKMGHVSSKAIYSRRKVIVEPVFAHIKNGGFRGFSVRGSEKVKGEFSLVCMAMNSKKIISVFKKAGKDRPKFGNKCKFG